MQAQAPKLIAINHDDYHASRVGRTQNGLQVLITTPFVSAVGGEPERQFLAIYLFDAKGTLVEARIDELGRHRQFDRDQALVDQRTSELGPIVYCRIEVQPFAIERFGTTFGLVPRPPEDEVDSWWVEMQPGNYMAFHEPWDSGEYDT